MTPEFGSTGFNGRPNVISLDWDSNFPPATFPDPIILPSDDIAFSWGPHGLARPPLLPPSENLPDYFWEISPYTSPAHSAERNNPSLFPAAPYLPSIHPQVITEPANNTARNRDPRHGYEEVSEGLAFTGSVHASVAAPIVPLWTPSFSLVPVFPANWVKIPQSSYQYGRKQLDFRQLEPITFSTDHHLGINLGDALRKNLTHLNGKDDPMACGSPGTISCRLLFPGYPDNGSSCQIHVVDWTKNRMPITRSKLAHEVSRKVDRYLSRMMRISPDASLEDHWRIGQGFMRIDNMYLVSLVSVSKGSFQPEIWVATSSMSHVGAENGGY